MATEIIVRDIKFNFKWNKKSFNVSIRLFLSFLMTFISPAFRITILKSNIAWTSRCKTNDYFFVYVIKLDVADE